MDTRVLSLSFVRFRLSFVRLCPSVKPSVTIIVATASGQQGTWALILCPCCWGSVRSALAPVDSNAKIRSSCRNAEKEVWRGRRMASRRAKFFDYAFFNMLKPLRLSMCPQFDGCEHALCDDECVHNRQTF